MRANALICLINQANYLLDRQIAALEKEFATTFPPCPLCSSPMVVRTARSGKNAGKQFWGRSTYPECKGAAEI